MLTSVFFFIIFKLMPTSMSSWVGGKIGVLLGKTQKYYNALIDANLKIAFPRKSITERKKIRKVILSILMK